MSKTFAYVLNLWSLPNYIKMLWLMIHHEAIVERQEDIACMCVQS